MHIKGRNHILNKIAQVEHCARNMTTEYLLKAAEELFQIISGEYKSIDCDEMEIDKYIYSFKKGPDYMLLMPTMEDLSIKLGISDQTIRRRLVELGTTWTDAVQEVREHVSINLLNKTNKSILEITLLCGYLETSTFHRWFKVTYGITASEIRGKH